MDPSISALYQIVAVGQNTNSYKFALWRALARLAAAKSVISKLDLAPLFLEYYWPLQLQYHVRQGTDPDKDPIVMRLIRELLADGTIEQGESLKDFKMRNVGEYERLTTRATTCRRQRSITYCRGRSFWKTRLEIWFWLVVSATAKSGMD